MGVAPWLARGPPKAGLAASNIYFVKISRKCFPLMSDLDNMFYFCKNNAIHFSTCHGLLIVNNEIYNFFLFFGNI